MSTPVVRVLVLALDLVWLHCLDTLGVVVYRILVVETETWISGILTALLRSVRVGELPPIALTWNE